MSAQPQLKAPYPWFGGKRRIAALVWERLGDASNAIEPFFGSGAWLLARPHAPKIETINDSDCYVANFWRATQHDPEKVADFADGPVNEVDLHSRHRWLVLSDDAAEFRRLAAKLAGVFKVEAPNLFGDVEIGMGEDGQPIVTSQHQKV